MVHGNFIKLEEIIKIVIKYTKYCRLNQNDNGKIQEKQMVILHTLFYKKC